MNNHPGWINYLQQFVGLGADAFKPMVSVLGSNSNSNGKFCVIVEPRQHPNLIAVIKNFMFMLQGTGWGLIVYHGPDNERFVKDGLNPAFLEAHHKVHYVRMAQSNLTTGEYSAMLCNPMFWQCLLDGFKCEHALIFQCDTLLLKGSKAIDAFLKYDYVGAPWPGCGIGMALPPNNRRMQMTVGNGGLSMRNVRAMLSITLKYPYPCELGVPEDVYFSYWMKVHETEYWVPTSDESSAFSMEHVHNPDAAGLHAPPLALECECEAMMITALARLNNEFSLKIINTKVI
jgi:hypothetical protein